MISPKETLKILILGSEGQLGKSLKYSLSKTNHEIFLASRKDLNLLDMSNINLIKDYAPNLIINCAAYTKVDLAESNEHLAMQVNAFALETLSEESKRIGAVLMHFSTDYIFDGKCQKKLNENYTKKPLSVYGVSKLAGENIIESSGVSHYIFRIGWLYSEYGHNFVKSIITNGLSKNSLSVVNDQFGSPTSCYFIADIIKHLIESKTFFDNFGTYHLSSMGVTNWYNFALKIKEMSLKIDNKFVADIFPITSDRSSNIAKRPYYVHLSKDKIKNVFNITIPSWENLLKKNFKEIYWSIPK